MSADHARDRDRAPRESEATDAALWDPETGDAPDPVTGPAPSAPQDGLTERDRMILALESRTFRYVGAKERAIREEIGISKVAYYVRLNALLDEPDALRIAPAMINRLRDRRTSAQEPSDAPRTGRVA